MPNEPEVYRPALINLGHGALLHEPDPTNSDPVSASPVSVSPHINEGNLDDSNCKERGYSAALDVDSPRPSRPPLQAPGTPPAGISSPPLSAGPRSNSNASTFVPSHAHPPQQRQDRIKITDISGHDLDLTELYKAETTSSTPSSDKNGWRAALTRLEQKKQEEKDTEEVRGHEVEEERGRLRKEEEVKAKAESETAAQADAEKAYPASVEIKSKKEGEAAAIVIVTLLRTIGKRRRFQRFLDLASTFKPTIPASALATAHHIQDVYQVQYPKGIKSPKPELNTNAKDGKFRYDREFLFQFMSVCKEKPDNLPPLEVIGIERVIVQKRRGGSGRKVLPSTTVAKHGSMYPRGKCRDAAWNEASCINASRTQCNASATTPLEPLAPLEHSANRWVASSTMGCAQAVDLDSPEVVEKKVRALLNKLTMEKFESISNQIIAWANRSENEKDGRTLIRVIQLVFEAINEAAWSEIFARLCRKIMEQISPNVQDEGIRNAKGKPITGGLLFRKYLLNRCQEDFERGWSNKETTAAAAFITANEDRKNAKEKNKEEGEEVMLYSDEYYAAQKAKRQGLGLIKFIGELFKLQMLTERIMHECIKKLLSNVDNPEEEEIESLCKLLTTVGQTLDASKARGQMDVYFSKMKELAKNNSLAPRKQFMLQDVIDLRERKWIPRNAAAAPTTLAQVHESATKEKARQEQHHMARATMSRGGSRRGHDQDGGGQVGPDGWAIAPGPSRPANKAGDFD